MKIPSAVISGVEAKRDRGRNFFIGMWWLQRLLSSVYPHDDYGSASHETLQTWSDPCELHRTVRNRVDPDSAAEFVWHEIDYRPAYRLHR